MGGREVRGPRLIYRSITLQMRHELASVQFPDCMFNVGLVIKSFVCVFLAVGLLNKRLLAALTDCEL